MYVPPTFEAIENVCSRATGLNGELFRIVESAARSELVSLISVLRDHGDGYLHPNGFYKISFHFGPNLSYRLRLHIWQDASRSPLQPIHNHSFDYISKVLVGSFVHRTYKQTASQTGVEKSEFAYHRSFRAAGDTYELNATGKQHVSQVRETRLSAGDTYQQPRELLHTINPDDSDYCATLLVSFAGGVDDPAIVLADRIEGAHVLETKNFEIPNLDKRARATIIDELVSKI